jgi:hypothetical protein
MTLRVSTKVVFFTFDEIESQRNVILISSKFRCFDFPKFRFQCRNRNFDFDEIEIPTKFHTDFVEISMSQSEFRLRCRNRNFGFDFDIGIRQYFYITSKCILMQHFVLFFTWKTPVFLKHSCVFHYYNIQKISL